MPQCFIIKLYSETQVSGRLGMSGGRSPRHAQNPLSGERRKMLSITHHALSPHPHIIICTSFHLINWLQCFYRTTMSLKRSFVPKGEVKQWFTTTTTLTPPHCHLAHSLSTCIYLLCFRATGSPFSVSSPPFNASHCPLTRSCGLLTPTSRAAGCSKDAYLRSLMLINVHGHINVYLRGNFVFFRMVPAVEQWLSAKIMKIRVKTGGVLINWWL